MGQIGRDRVADDKPLDVWENPFYRHGRASEEVATSWGPEKEKATARTVALSPRTALPLNADGVS